MVSAEERKSNVEAFLGFAHSAWYFAKALSAQILANEMQVSIVLLITLVIIDVQLRIEITHTSL
jgi:hypothetical protein